MTIPSPRLRLVLVGYGRMGRLVDSLSDASGFDVVRRLDVEDNAGGAGLDRLAAETVDVAIDFSVADAVAMNLPKLAAAGVNVVIGTTGWRAHEARLRQVVADAGIGVVASPNFSLGMTLFQALAEASAALFAPHADYGVWLHEIHHAAKRDAPSGTALALRDAMAGAGCARAIDVASSRAGHVPGTHTVGFDGPYDAVTLTHTVRDRATFAIGALAAARWLCGRRGWFGVRDVLGLGPAS